MPCHHALANTLRELDVPQEWTHEIVRRKSLSDQSAFTKRAMLEPDVVKQELIENVRSFLGKDFDVELHEAITEVPMPGQEGKVIDEVQKGYYLKGKLIRFAKVVVGK